MWFDVLDVQLKEKVTDIEADHIRDAVAMLYDEFILAGYEKISRSIIDHQEGLVIFALPYGRNYIFRVVKRC